LHSPVSPPSLFEYVCSEPRTAFAPRNTTPQVICRQRSQQGSKPRLFFFGRKLIDIKQRKGFFFVSSFLHSTYVDHGNKIQNALVPATTDPPQVTVKLWFPQPPSSPSRTSDCEDKRKTKEGSQRRQMVVLSCMYPSMYSLIQQWCGQR